MLQELHILLFLGGLSVLSATLVPAQASLVMFALMATGRYAALSVYTKRSLQLSWY